MDKRKLSIAVISATVLLAVAVVTATPLASKTPLYKYRMEHASSKMNFLPTTVNSFIYTAEKGYTVNYNSFKCSECGGGATPLLPYTCGTCDEEICVDTTCPTCPITCHASCEETSCPDRCPWTEWPYCEYTKEYPTCWWPEC